MACELTFDFKMKKIIYTCMLALCAWVAPSACTVAPTAGSGATPAKKSDQAPSVQEMDGAWLRFVIRRNGEVSVEWFYVQKGKVFYLMAAHDNSPNALPPAPPKKLALYAHSEKDSTERCDEQGRGWEQAGTYTPQGAKALFRAGMQMTIEPFTICLSPTQTTGASALYFESREPGGVWRVRLAGACVFNPVDGANQDVAQVLSVTAFTR